MGKKLDAVKDDLISVDVMLFFPLWAAIDTIIEKDLGRPGISEEEAERKLKFVNDPNTIIAIGAGMLCTMLCIVWMLTLVI